MAEAVGHRQCSRHWYLNIQQWNIRGSRDGKHQRQHQHETHFIEQGKTNGKTGQYHRPLDVFLPNLAISVVAIRCAPPQSASILPSIAPKPMIRAKATERSADTSFDGANNFYPAASLALIQQQAPRGRDDEAVHFEADHRSNNKITDSNND